MTAPAAFRKSDLDRIFKAARDADMWVRLALDPITRRPEIVVSKAAAQPADPAEDVWDDEDDDETTETGPAGKRQLRP